jgi:hypothetical protein
MDSSLNVSLHAKDSYVKFVILTKYSLTFNIFSIIWQWNLHNPGITVL